MANLVKLQLVTLNGLKFDDDVYEIIIPTLDGDIGVMPGHMPLVGVAKPGVISIRRSASDRDEYMEDFAISGGAIEVKDNLLRILVDEADHSNEINEQEAEKAYQRAKELVKEAKNQVELDKAQSLVDRHAVRLQVSEIRRKKRLRSRP